MPSHSRNSRKPLQALRLTVAAALLTGSVVHAADQPGKFVLTAYSNGVGGEQLLKGDYASALAKVRGRHASDSMEGSLLSTNQCIAYTMNSQFEPARAACEAAVTGALHDVAASSNMWERQTYKDYLAVAYSNRAVLRWLSNDAVSAALDLASAASLSPHADFVARNIVALRSPHEHTVARAEVATTP
jgi:hypothetical protein